MIFITLGTQDSPFPRIIELAEQAVTQLDLTDKIVVQSGTTIYDSPRITVQAYMNPEEYSRLFQEARVIISHGGAGSLYKAMRLGKKCICLPRRAELGEHNDNHQFELANKLASQGHIVLAHGDLVQPLRSIESFTPKPYSADNSKIIEAIDTFVQEVASISGQHYD